MTLESLTLPDNGTMGSSLTAQTQHRRNRFEDNLTRLTIVCPPGVTPDQLAELLIRAWHAGLIQAWSIDPPTKRKAS
jgi:hypothetical protein